MHRAQPNPFVARAPTRDLPMDMPLEHFASNAAEVARLLKSMANESRLMILCHLSEREMTVSELGRELPLSQSALSQHLGILRREAIVATRREAQFVRYSLASEDVRAIIATLCGIYQAER
jgi:DNA-binding transcriptional ArsR family regulator